MNREQYRKTECSNVHDYADDFVMSLADNDCLDYYNTHDNRPDNTMPSQIAPQSTLAILTAMQWRLGVDYWDLYDNQWINTESEFT